MNLRLSRHQRDVSFAAILLLPAVLLLGLTIVSPLVKSVVMSFTDYSLLAPDVNWNNFENYKKLMVSADFYHSLKITLIYVVAAVSADLLLGLTLAFLLNRNIRFRSFFRSIVMIPWAIPTIVTALIFLWIYQSDYGVLNYVLVSTGVMDSNINWLQSTDFALASIIVVAVFRQTPLVSVMLLAGLQNISASLYEAAKIDGASGWRLFTNITLPLLKPVISSVTLIMIVNNFQMFTLFFTLTNGGPAGSTTSLAILTYETAFSKYEMGIGSAIGVIWLVLLFTFSVFFTRIMNRDER
ncbi:multiple sugar transport system permease protein [Paenibacillus sp. UNCCL117]|uniref:carbohydrate ABC transporter permease n=1 Tax=unclassified Paenibacillus TaxID=185978 RepID=UPI00087FC4FF|nr:MULTISPECIES: sugar ABC transporter permease [unclassified Paenibacillus]SDE07385.1 carbohydrate ABC transporter membrane protein 1, CUT1 family [Paenibacillus sp. cl123]SFW59182.1 multiple sugar transport system permease protein [Paenibacillus sp. UNCCL117]